LKQDIRLKTCLVVSKQNKYLVGFSGVFLRWSDSPWEAWQTRDKKAARKVADKIGGTLALFNPIVGQIRQYGN